MSPPISVMIGVYNGAKYIGEAIESVLAQDYAPLELIVVDDGSDDGSGDVASSYSEVRCVRQERGGNGAARNRAVELASHDFFAFLDADRVHHSPHVVHALLERRNIGRPIGQPGSTLIE